MEKFNIKEKEIEPFPLSEMAKIIMKRKRDNARLGLMASHKKNLNVETHLAHSRGWFMVFQTLTVKNEYYDEVFSAGDMKFSRYIRQVQRQIGKALGMTARAADKAGSSIHRYFAVVEYGTKTDRAHIHILHLCKKLPYGSFDPNGRRGSPTHREIAIMKTYWPYADITAPIAVRYGYDDAFSRAGWKWPHEKNKKGILVPIKSGIVIKIANYVSKYINKTIGVEQWTKTTRINWRVRTSRQLGRIELNSTLRKLQTKDLLRFLQENKARNPDQIAKRPNLPSYRKIRSSALSVLMSRRILITDFLDLELATPILRRGQLTEQYFKTLKLKNGNFIHSKQMLIDSGISNALAALEKAYYINDDPAVVNITASGSIPY